MIKKDIQLFQAFKKAFGAAVEDYMNPFFKFDPRNNAKVKETKEAIRYIRKIGLFLINQRLEMLENKEDLPDDILTCIIKTASKLRFQTNEITKIKKSNFFISRCR